MRGSTGSWTSVALISVLGACTWINHIDVCERSRAPERQMNRRTEGDQRAGTLRSVAPMPGGGGLVVFRSAATGSPADGRSEIRGVLVDPAGNPMPTCEQSTEHTYAAATGALEEVQVRANPALAAPLSADEGSVGLLAWVEDDDASMSVQALGLGVAGCPFGRDPAPFEVVSATPGCRVVRDPSASSRCMTSTSVARLSSTDFAVVWLDAELDAGLTRRTELWARVIRVDFLGLRGRATVLDREGAAVALVTDGQLVTASTLELDESRFLLLWQQYGGGRLGTFARVYDDRLEAQGPTVRVHEAETDELPAAGPSVAASRLGERVLVVWTHRDGRAASRVFGRFLDTSGAIAAGPNGDDAFRISDHIDGEEARPAVTTFEGGYLVAWTLLDSERDGDGSGSSVRAVLLDERGRRRFANPACDHASFQLNRGEDGDQRAPVVATLAAGQVLAVWSDEGRNGADLSGSSVAAVVEDRRSMLPIE